MDQSSVKPSVDFIKGFTAQSAVDCVFYLIAYQCAPVIEQAKPGAIVSLGNDRVRKLNDLWRRNRSKIPQTDFLRFWELRVAPKRTTVLFYRPDLIRNVLTNPAVANYLINCGYRKELTLETALTDLARRFQQGCPHEMGLFLGIPLADVLGFIANRGRNAIAEGYWKIYNDLVRQMALFDRYQEAKRRFISLVKAGNRPLEYLAGQLLTLEE
jgi:hypothetical protein